MNISPINSTPVSAVAFNGKILTKGYWPQSLSDAFYSSEGIKALASDDKIIIGSLSTTSAKFNDFQHTMGETLYKLKLDVRSEKPSLLEKIKNLTGFSKHKINEHYHSEGGMYTLLRAWDKDFYLKKLNG